MNYALRYTTALLGLTLAAGCQNDKIVSEVTSPEAVFYSAADQYYTWRQNFCCGGASVNTDAKKPNTYHYTASNGKGIDYDGFFVDFDHDFHVSPGDTYSFKATHTDTIHSYYGSEKLPVRVSSVVSNTDPDHLTDGVPSHSKLNSIVKMTVAPQDTAKARSKAFKLSRDVLFNTERTNITNAGKAIFVLAHKG